MAPLSSRRCTLANFLTAPFKLFDSQNTLDKIRGPSLIPVTGAAVRIIESTVGQQADVTRAKLTPELL